MRQKDSVDRTEVVVLDAANLDSAALCDFDLLVNATNRVALRGAVVGARPKIVQGDRS